MSSVDRPAPMKRALLAAGTASYEHAWNQMKILDKVPLALRDMVAALTGLGFSAVTKPPGYNIDLTKHALSAAVKKAAAAAPVVVMYYTGHGADQDRGTYYLVTRKSRPRTLDTSALAARELLGLFTLRDDDGMMLLDQPTVLVILDCCYSGSAGMKMLKEALSGIGNPNTWVIASAGPLEYAQEGVFARAFREALVQQWVGPSQEFLSLDTMIQAVKDAIVREVKRGTLAGLIEQEPRLFPPATGVTGIMPFFPNPRYRLGLAGMTVDEQQHWPSRVRGGPDGSQAGFYLTGTTGRLLAAEHLAKWMTDPRDRGLAVVTGSPGTGKSALLALPALLANPTQREDLLRANRPSPLIKHMAVVFPAETPVTAIHARGLNTDETARVIAEALDRTAGTASALLEDLEKTPERHHRVVIVDGIDEVAAPATLLESLLVPLSRRLGVRVVVGARHHVLARIADRDMTIDLDAADYRDRKALTTYIHRLLIAEEEPGVTTCYQAGSDTADGARGVFEAAADAIAERATVGGQGAESFLVGRLLALAVRAQPKPADIISPEWLPASVAVAVDEELGRLGSNPYPARVLLQALAWAKGPGLPWETIWAPVATALAGESGEPSPPSNEDIRQLLLKAGAYVIEDRGPGRRSVYRPFHDLFAAHLRGEPSPEQISSDRRAVERIWEPRRRQTEKAIYDALLAVVPSDGQTTRDWINAHPYLRTYLAQHAAAAGRATLAALAADIGFLSVADPVTLSPLLSPAIAELRDVACIYRHARPWLGEDTRANAGYLQEASRALKGAVGNVDLINAVAFGATAGGQLLLASASWDGTVRLWDPVTGALADELIGHTGGVSSVAFGTTPGGQLLLASGDDEGMVRLWDPATGVPVGKFLGHTGGVSSVAFGTTPGGQLLLASGGEGGMVRLWDPATGAAAGDPLPGHTGGMNAVAFGTTPGGQLLLASGGEGGMVRLWDPATGAAAGDPLPGHTGWVNAVAFGTTASGQLLLASSGDAGMVRLWDPATGAAAGDPLPGHTGWVNAVAFGTTASGQLLLASSGDAGMVRLWDPLTGAYSPATAVGSRSL